MSREERLQIAERLEEVLITLRHKGVRDLYVINEMDDIIDELQK